MVLTAGFGRSVEPLHPKVARFPTKERSCVVPRQVFPEDGDCHGRRVNPTDGLRDTLNPVGAGLAVQARQVLALEREDDDLVTCAKVGRRGRVIESSFAGCQAAIGLCQFGGE